MCKVVALGHGPQPSVCHENGYNSDVYRVEDFGREWQQRLFARIGKGPLWYPLTDERLPKGHPAREVIVKLGYTLNGRLVISGVLVGAESDVEFTGRMLREVSPEAARDVLASPKFWSGSSSMRETLPTWGKGRPKGRKPFDYAAIAADYRVAVRIAPGAPMTALAKKYRKHVATVRGYVRRARAMGLLD